jgi:hypothetical protein
VAARCGVAMMLQEQYTHGARAWLRRAAVATLQQRTAVLHCCCCCRWRGQCSNCQDYQHGSCHNRAPDAYHPSVTAHTTFSGVLYEELSYHRAACISVYVVYHSTLSTR